MPGTLTQELSERVWATPQFHNELGILHAANVVRSLSGNGVSLPAESLVKRLLQAATYLASSVISEHRQAAHLIAISSFNLYAESLPNLPNLLHVILGRLGNFPAVSHLYRLLNQEVQYRIPASALYELLSHEKANSVRVNEKDLVFTDFQRGLWELLRTDRVVSVSAPTSAGKSFALQQFLIHSLLTDQSKFILYLVPTRALIHQVSDVISETTSKMGATIQVSTIPQSPSTLGMARGVFILTQERAHVLMELEEAPTFDIVVLDEAQTIGDGARGILLQVVLEKLLRTNPAANFFFSSPFSRNPEHFNYLFPAPVSMLKDVNSPVLKNMICVDVDEQNADVLKLSLHRDGAVMPLTEITLDRELRGDEPTFAYISYKFGKDSKNLVYCGSPAKCESVADKIRQWRQDLEGPAQPSQELKDFAALVRDHIHRNYQLADMIEHGIVFHYGKMPTILRKAIEYYFSHSNDIKFLVCTSTLLHGVNFPARNLFILKPSEGEKWLNKNAKPMASPSFWNLAGRAGRLGKDFEGNVFLVNKSQWQGDPMAGEKEQSIRSSFYDVISDKHESILAMAQGEAEVQPSEVEAAFTKLYSDYRNGRLNEVLAKAPIELPAGFKTAIIEKCKPLAFDVPNRIIESNVSVSPFRQQRMLAYIKENLQTGEHKKLVPPHPQNPDSYQGYVRLFSRYEKYFDGRVKPTGSPKYLAVIALEWMRGAGYPRIIEESIKRNPNKTLPTIIRELMDTIENKLRFRAVQQTQCYIDLLRHALATNNLEQLGSSIPSIPLYLELGACSGTMVNLIGIGLSRTTASLLNNKSANRNMSREECLRWIGLENWNSSDLPKFCIHEVLSVIEGQSRIGQTT